MSSLNKVFAIGNLGKDPSMSYTPSGKAVVKVSMACNESWTGANGEKQERTEWLNLEAWGKTAETMNTYLHKGSKIFVEGKIRTDKWEDNGVTKYFTKVIVASFQFLDKKGDSENYPSSDGTDAAEQAEAGVEQPEEDSIPF